jgi:hypothetical protein
MVDPKDYEIVNNYISPPIMPGIRKLYGVPEERHRLIVDLEAPFINPIYSNIPNYGSRRIPHFYPINGTVEGFSSPRGRFFLRLIAFILILGLIYYLSQKD